MRAAQKRNKAATHELLAKNIKYLKDKHGMTDVQMGRKCGVSPKTINNMYNNRTKVQLDNIEAVASVFGLEPWLLLMLDLSEIDGAIYELNELCCDYARCSNDGRKHILMVAEREALYSSHDPA